MAKEDWLIRGVDSATKKIIRVYAAEHEVSIAQALMAIIKEWEAKK